MIATRPSRPPDYYSPHGTMFWFDEMVYLQPDQPCRPMSFDQENNKLIPDVAVHKGNRKIWFASHVQEARDRWWAEIFESKFTSS